MCNVLIVDTFREVRSKREKRKEVILLRYVNIDMRLNLSLMMNNVCMYFDFR